LPRSQKRRAEIELPGPNSKKLIEREKKAITPAHYHYLPIAIESGGLKTMNDADGNTYLDFTAGAAVMGVGYKNPKVVKALEAQLEKFVSHSLFFGTFEPLVKLTEKVKELVPWPGLKDGMLAYGASGSEAVEMALWIVRKSKRPVIMALFPSYHGRTLAANALTAMRSSWRRNTLTVASGVTHSPYPYCYRCPFKLEYPDCGMACVSYIESMFDMVVPPEDVGAFIMEPIGGSGGYQVPPPEYIPMVKKLCEKHGIKFISDEIQSGFGRTGKMFGIEHYGVEPDMATLGKPLGGGLPIGAVLADKETMGAWEAGSWGSTFGGNVLSAVAGHATLSIIQEEKLDKNAEKMGRILLDGMEGIKDRRKIVGDARGKGLMLAIELVKDRKTKEPAPEVARATLQAAMKRGLLISTAGTYGNDIRLLPPLNINEEEANQALDVLDESLKAVTSK
jgi:4-aminobutyrate aminotransferase